MKKALGGILFTVSVFCGFLCLMGIYNLLTLDMEFEDPASRIGYLLGYWSTGLLLIAVTAGISIAAFVFGRRIMRRESDDSRLPVGSSEPSRSIEHD